MWADGCGWFGAGGAALENARRVQEAHHLLREHFTANGRVPPSLDVIVEAARRDPRRSTLQVIEYMHRHLTTVVKP